MKIIPQDRTQSVFPKTCVENVNLPDAIDRYNRNKFAPKTCITFIGSEPGFDRLSEALPPPTFESRFCPSFNLLIRSGLYQNSDIFVLTDPIHTADANDVERILSDRCQTKIKIILWDEKSLESLTQAVADAAAGVELFNAKELIAEDIIKRSRESLDTGETDEPDQSTGRNADTLDEEEFRKFVRIKLENHLDSSPENILSKAIEIIKS
jgi:hypothetical protein